MKRFSTTLTESLNVKALGEKAEEFLKVQLLNWLQERGENVKVYHALRVPRANHRGKWELDFVILSEQCLIVLEVKFWSGQVSVAKDGSWIQTSRNKVLSHQNAIQLNHDKLKSLQSFLSHQGHKIPENRCFSWLVWMNDIKLDASIANDPSSFSVNRLENRLLSMIPQKSYFSKCLDFFKGKNHRLPFEKLASSLDLLPTWDCVKLTDGSVLKGDIVDFEMTLNSGVKLGRKDFKSLERKNRRFPWLYSKPDYFVAYHELGRAVKLKFSDTHTNVTIKLAGSTRQVVFSLAELSKLELGWVSHMDGVQHSEVQIRQGDVRQGKITGIKDFGVFVRLGNYQDGLIHASTLKGAQLQDFRLDQTVKVKVVHINNEKPKSHIYLQLES